MFSNVYKREAYIETIRKYAESNIVGNQAFLGVKGVGKTSLFQSFFTKSKRSELAQKYKKLFVFSQLDSRKKGTDLYQFLLDQVKIGIMAIPDPIDKKNIKEGMKEINEIFETPDGRLNQYLTLIKEHRYDLIIIMDQFHCMSRDSQIGKEQYDILRSYNEQKLITYWIITDTDLIETCATEQYIASFFAQKFTSKMTIRPLEPNERGFVINLFAVQKKVKLTINEKNMIDDVSDGIPELMSILIDIFAIFKNEQTMMDTQAFIQAALSHNACSSLLDGWLSGLTINQKKILFEVASSDNGIQEEELTTTMSKMAELADDVGRGLLHICKTSDKKNWFINTEFLKQYILSKGEAFYSDTREAKTDDCKEPSVTNIFNIEGNFIQNQTNNILKIENAIAGLEDLQKLFQRHPVLLDETQATEKLNYLPFKQKVWQEMDEHEQEVELTKYADGIFSSDIFTNCSLTPEQMQTFCLTDHLLDNLSDNCRKQIVCGIQVYDLIQLCINRFGLSMNESESPRGILFARAFEKHLKDFAAPAFYRIPEFATQYVYPTTKPFREYPLDKTTIGVYSCILKTGYPILAQASKQLLGYHEKNEIWWKELANRMSVIGNLRNQCCHSGTTFGQKNLADLIDKIFTEQSLDDILLFGKIPALRRNQFSLAQTTAHTPLKTSNNKHKLDAIQYKFPDISLIGTNVQFKVLSKTGRGNFKGIVNNLYEGSLPKSYCVNLEYTTVKNTTLHVKVDKIQDGKYILRL